MNPALRASAAHLFVDSLMAPEPGAGDAHHLFRVLRVRNGETVTVSNGAGAWRETRVSDRGLVPTGEITHEPAPRPCTIATAVPKGDRLEWMVEKLTEIGVQRLVLVDFARSVVRWDDERASRQLTRLGRIMREAAMQSRRVWLPRLEGPVPFTIAAAIDGLVLADPFGGDGRLGAAVAVGPEGGVTPEELALCGRTVTLGASVLRVETASLVACARILTEV